MRPVPHVHRHRADVDAVRQQAGVGDQSNECVNGTAGCPGPNADVDELACLECLLEADDGDREVATDGGQPECDYCGSSELAYEMRSDRGMVVRCIPCLAIEQGQQQINMRFERFVDFDADGIVYDSDEDKRESRKFSYELCRSWWRVLARWRQDDPLVKRDPDDHEPTLHESVRESLENLMGSAAYYSPSEITESDGDPEQTKLTDGGQVEKTTHDVVLEQIDEQDDGKHGAPIGAVVEATLEETEVGFRDVLETIIWQYDHSRIYQPARGHLRRTDHVIPLNGGDER